MFIYLYPYIYAKAINNPLKVEKNHCQDGKKVKDVFGRPGARVVMFILMRIKNDLEFQSGKYQSRATCFDIILT